MARTYEEAIRYDSELMRLSEEIMNLDALAGRNPRAAILARIASAQQRLEARHQEIRREINNEEEAAKFESEEAKANANPIGLEFEAFLSSQGKNPAIVDILGRLFLDHYNLMTQQHSIRKKMAAQVDAFIQDLSEEKLQRYAAQLEGVKNAIGNLEPDAVANVFECEGDGSENESTLFSLGDEFLEAARLLQETRPTRIVVNSVTYYLLGHSAELILKALLYKRGVPITVLMNFGHDLRKLAESAYKHQLPEDVSLKRLLELADIYKDKKLEYRDQSKKEFPNLELLAEEIKKLQSVVFSILCVEERNV